MKLEELKRKKKEKGLTNEDLAEVSGVPLGTVQRIMSGATMNPRHDTWAALERALSGEGLKKDRSSKNQSATDSPDSQDKSDLPERIGESLPAYTALHGKKQGGYTLEDYYALPEEVDAELIDGVFYDMSAAPTTYHQVVAAEIYVQIQMCIRKNKKNCILLYEADVQLDNDGHTMVRPDILLVCDLGKITEKCICGAPDFVAEVFSPHTRKKDMTVKLQKYCNAGVNVYWMVDVKKRQIITYDFTEEDFTPVIYPLEGKVRLTLQEGECELDFDHVSEMLRSVYGI